MSVWKAACYRDDALQNIVPHLNDDVLDSRFVVSLCDFDVEPAGDHRLPAGVVPGNLKAQVEGNPQIIRGVTGRAARKGPYPAAFARLVKELPEARFGVHGVYKFVAENWAPFTDPAPATKVDATFYDTTFAFGYAASYRTAREAVAKAKTCRASLAKHVEGPYQAIRDLISLGTRLAGKVYKREARFADFYGDPYPIVEKDVPRWLRRYDIYWWKSVLILVNPIRGYCYVLTRDDIDRIERFVLGLAWANFYLAEYSNNSPDLANRLNQARSALMDVIHEALNQVSKRGANTLCRAFDVAVWVYCASISQDINSNSYNLQLEKVRNEKLDQFVDQAKIQRIVGAFKTREALELLQIYKAFPQPDFDYFGAAHRQELLYSTNPVFGEAAVNENTGPYENLWKYFEYTLIRAYHKKHGVCPGSIKNDVDHKKWHDSYPYIDPEKIPFDEVTAIDYGNCFRYQAHGQDIVDLIRDKAICPESVARLATDAEVRKLDVSDKNYLMDVLTRTTPINLLDLNKNTDNLFQDVKAEDKPEAKKPNGRWFFEAHTDRRLVQSEYETSVAEYGKSTAGCMQGKSTREKIATMNYICELKHGEEISDSRSMFLSFDLAKFSPSLGMEYHAKTDEILSRAFGQPHLANAYKVYTEGNIHYIKRQVHHSFPKMGRDFEGFSGKKNTIYHCAVMGYCVRRLRDLKLIDRGGRFTSFVDDGLLRIEIPKVNFEEDAVRILQVIEDVYRMANLYISWDKTFVSSNFAVFLNEYYYRGTPVTPGIRSFLKISSRSDSLCPSFVDDAAKLESTCRGAIAAGAPANIVYASYCFHLKDLFDKWGKGKAKYTTKLALACFIPIQLGGFGMCSVAGLSGSIQGPSIVEGIGNLRAIAVRFPNLAPAINKCLNVEMRQISPEEKLRAPHAVKRMGRVLKSTRARQVIEKRLYFLLDTPVIRALLGDVSIRQDDSVISCLVDRAKVPVETLETIHDSTLGSAISNLAGKFLRSRTAFKLINPRGFYRATIANMTEARALVDEWSH